MTTATEIEAIFAHHPPSNSHVVNAHQFVRSVMTDAAIKLNTILPDSREKSLALTAMQEAGMWANAAIAIHQEIGSEKGPDPDLEKILLEEDFIEAQAGHPSKWKVGQRLDDWLFRNNVGSVWKVDGVVEDVSSNGVVVLIDGPQHQALFIERPIQAWAQGRLIKK